MEGATGLDTEFMVAGEPFPAIIFGFVPGPSLNRLPSGGTGSINGVVEAVKIYIPAKGGVAGLPGTIWGGLAGAKIDTPIPNPWVTLTDLANGDTVVWVGRGDANGRFHDSRRAGRDLHAHLVGRKLNYILDLVSVTVGDGETVDMGILPLTGWWTRFDGYVFDDRNRNGSRWTPASRASPTSPSPCAGARTRSWTAARPSCRPTRHGYYVMENAYPDDAVAGHGGLQRRALHAPASPTRPTTSPPRRRVLGAGVDVSVLPIIGLVRPDGLGQAPLRSHRRDGVDRSNGGIVGTVSYDTTRNELDPRYAAVEDWQPGISGLTVEPVRAGRLRHHAAPPAIRRAGTSSLRTAPTPRASSSTPT